MAEKRARKKSKKEAPYKKTSRKLTVGDKKVTVYIRRSDGCECMRRRTSNGKYSYYKLRPAAK